MNRLMYSGLRWFKLMKCSKLLLSTFWNSLSLLKASEMILQGQGVCVQPPVWWGAQSPMGACSLLTGLLPDENEWRTCDVSSHLLRWEALESHEDMQQL